MIIEKYGTAHEISQDLHQRKLVVLTQEEAESSVLCEDTSVAHPKVDKVDGSLSNSSQSNSRNCTSKYYCYLSKLRSMMISSPLSSLGCTFLISSLAEAPVLA